MKLRNLPILLFIFMTTCIFGAITLHSQELQFGLDFQVGAAQGEFKDQLDNRPGIGMGGMVGYRFGQTPLMLGIDMGFMNFGKETREEPLSSTIPDLRVEVENSYNLFHGDVLFRLIPAPMTVRPFLDGLFGFNYFFTETVLRERGGIGSDDDIIRDTNFKDTAMSYGFGAGVQFRIFSDDGTNDENGSNFPYSINIHLMSRYMVGREAEYLREGSIIRENGDVTYDVINSTTDLLYFKLGLVVNL